MQNKTVIYDLPSVWRSALLQTVEMRTISDKMHKCYDEYHKMKKHNPSKKNHKANVDKFTVIPIVLYEILFICQHFYAFQTSTNKLFDISHCKCDTFKNCSCANHKEVPIERHQFLSDQRYRRKLTISGLHGVESLKNQCSFIEKSQSNVSDNNISQIEYIESPSFGVEAVSSVDGKAE